MILKSIKLENFRQYYGYNEIVFAEGNQNVTILFGGNGEGKTGIFRALMFGMFGDENIEQDDKKTELHLVNRKAMNENPGELIESHVTVEFEHNLRKYVVTRSMTGVSINGKYQEQRGPTHLLYTDEYGNMLPNPITDEEIVDYEISKVVHDQMKNFFFFDGEQIDTLTTTKTRVRNSVRDTIRTVTQIDDLTQAKSILSKMQRNLDAQIKEKSSSHHHKRAIDEKTKLLNQKDNNEQELEFLNLEEIELQKNIDFLDERIKASESGRHISLEIDLIKEKLNNTKNRYKDYTSNFLRQSINNVPLALLKDHEEHVSYYLQGEYQKQQNIIPLPVLEKSKLEKKCACCGLSLKEHLDAIEAIEEQINNYEHNLLTDFISKLSYHYGKNFVSEIENELKEFLENEYSTRQEIEGFEKELELQNNKLKETSMTSEELDNIIRNKEISEKDYEKLRFKILTIERENEEVKKQLEVLEKEIEKYNKEQEGLQIYVSAKEKVDKALSALEPSLQTYENKMQETLTHKTTEIFKQLIDKQDQALISQILINERYEINILDRDGTNFSQDISQGQRKIAAISFIIALASIASESTGVITYPFFMDTPFANFDLDHRLTLIKLLPNFISQWILLLTDTEMSIQEEKAFKETQKIGNWYRIKKVEDYHSKIIKVGLDEDMIRTGM